MLSKKLAFSLKTCFTILIAFGLAYFVASAIADGNVNKTHLDTFDVMISAGEEMIDVDHRGGNNDIQIATGRDRADRDITELNGLAITLLIEFGAKVELISPDADADDELDPEEDDIQLKGSGGAFGIDDIYTRAFDKAGRSLGVLTLDKVATVGASILAFRDTQKPGQQFLVRVDEDELTNAYQTALRAPDEEGIEIYSVVFFIPRGNAPHIDKHLRDGGDASVVRGVRKADLDHAIAHIGPDAHQHLNEASNPFRVDLVDDDEGMAMYNVGVSDTPVAEGTPGVVSIMRVVDRAGFVETGDFDVRIILTEEPRGGFTTDLIMVENGSVAAIGSGLTYKGAATHPDPDQDSELTYEMVNYIRMNDGMSADKPSDLPEATGRNNMYREYIATIRPNPDLNGTVTVSIKQFEDNVKPVSNQYIPLTREQRLAVTLEDDETDIRDARVANESLTVRVSTAADTTSKGAIATAAYAARDKIFEATPNLKMLDTGLVIPANGYLVLVRGNTDSDPIAGVVSTDAKLLAKKTAAQKLYNVKYEFELPFPADDLSNFFRNGGTLSLAHADIPEGTGSGHDDAAASAGGDTTHADYTGYVGATSTAIAPGDVIINEIMWGLDVNSPNSQYIELHNTTASDIGLDNKEWAIVVGTPPSGFGVIIDTAGNIDAKGDSWEVPGTDGVSKLEPSAGFVTLVDLVSMSRISAAAIGTEASSWVASTRPSQNLSGHRIGTPGAENNFPEPAPTPTPTPTPKAPVATGSDIMISEVMVASNAGRLPQWIELANVSGMEVSLMGWSVDVDNDPADADVIAESVNVTIGNVTVGKDQVVLIVTKTGRNSGVGTGTGDLRADRIVNVRSQVSPTDARYSLISESAFKIALLPPQKSGVVERGDVAGNLGMGWELPMSEGSRSSLIRREMGDAGEILGTDAAGWVLASNTALSGAYRTTYYGDDEDEGTPGYDAGGTLPVELSMFTAARDRVTGQVIITWETQSELNNAGFFIKRSQQQAGEFVIVNPTMIAGAGTTGEKQSYTYTDTTAKPNIVYYYQIEDVSLDGNRQTLTRAHRLKGHIGAAGKLTILWGTLKAQD